MEDSLNEKLEQDDIGMRRQEALLNLISSSPVTLNSPDKNCIFRDHEVRVGTRAVTEPRSVSASWSLTVITNI